MDPLVEVEGSPAAIERAIERTGIDRAAFTADSLADFVRRFEARTGEPALLGDWWLHSRPTTLDRPRARSLARPTGRPPADPPARSAYRSATCASSW